MICYDLRFPVWSRNRWNSISHKLNYDLLIYVANWPMIRVNSWDTLLHARAIENLSYVVGVNRVGVDGNGIEYNGNSAIIDPEGDSIFKGDDMEIIKTVQLSANSLNAFRDRFPAYMDADDFTVELGEFEETNRFDN